MLKVLKVVEQVGVSNAQIEHWSNTHLRECLNSGGKIEGMEW